jgi:hypothetical protein
MGNIEQIGVCVKEIFMNRFRKIAQAPPMTGPTPPMGSAPPMGAPPMGMPPMGAPPMGMPAMPATGPMGAPSVSPMASSPPERPEIDAALDSLGKILYDVDVTEQIENNSATSADDLAMKIWIQYGGRKDGQVEEGKVGQRGEDAIPPQEAEKERKATNHSKWMRLPLGQTIADVTSLEEITKVMTPLMLEVTKSAKAGEAGAAGGAGGGMPPGLASIKANMIRIANQLDKVGLSRYADTIDKFASKKDGLEDALFGIYCNAKDFYEQAEPEYKKMFKDIVNCAASTLKEQTNSTYKEDVKKIK